MDDMLFLLILEAAVNERSFRCDRSIASSMLLENGQFRSDTKDGDAG